MLKKILESYKWYDHPEGLKFVETHRDRYRTSGLWLLMPNAFSAFHRVHNNEETWYIHQGKIVLHIMDPEGKLSTGILGTDLENGEQPAIAVPKNFWQAAELEPGVEYGFGSVVCAPAFEFSEFEIADRNNMIAEFPEHSALIRKLTL